MALKPVFYVKIEGLRELDAALGELPKATARNVLKRTSTKALTPMIEATKRLVPVLSGRLKRSLAISTRLSKRQARLARKEKKGFFEQYAGPAALPHAHLVEFGTFRMAPKPFMRPAWDETKKDALEITKQELGKEIELAAARMRRKTVYRHRSTGQGLRRGKLL